MTEYSCCMVCSARFVYSCLLSANINSLSFIYRDKVETLFRDRAETADLISDCQLLVYTYFLVHKDVNSDKHKLKLS